MDVLNSFPAIYSTITLTIALLLPLAWILRAISINRNPKPKPPEAGGGWPVIGHVHLLRGQEPLHIILGNMADKYGPIFTIRLGVRRALVVNDKTTIKECLTTNDRAFASRPKLAASTHLCYNMAMMGFAPYGPYWRKIRMLTTLELLSNKRLHDLRHVRESEVRLNLQELYEMWNRGKNIGRDGKLLIDMNTWFWDLTLNLITRMTIGKRISGTYGDNKHDIERFKKAIKEFVELTGKFAVSDAFPFLRWLDIGGNERTMKLVAKELDQLVERWLQEHKKKKVSANELKDNQDFMDVMLSVLTNMGGHEADNINKANCLGLIMATEDSTTITLTWALSLLLNNHDTLEKVQNELDTVVGENRLVNESDLKNLVYLEAVIKETMRLYPATPLSLIHEATEDFTVSGYQIRAGTWLIQNLYKIHRDSEIWLEPLEFRPDRFLTTHKHVDVRGQNFELIPFGSGRRMCPAVSFALQVVQLTLANLLHWFDVAPPGNEPIDMQEGIGLTLTKATSLEVLIAPRLPLIAYESSTD